MALIRWDPAREVNNLQSDMNRLFDTFFQGRGGVGNGGQRWIPAMDLTETDSQYVLRADLPGMKREDIEVEGKDNVLTISGERRAEHHEQGEGFHRVERGFGRFSRSLDLPSGVDLSAVTADLEDGVLLVTIPKPQEAQPTRVEVREGTRDKVIEAQST